MLLYIYVFKITSGKTKTWKTQNIVPTVSDWCASLYDWSRVFSLTLNFGFIFTGNNEKSVPQLLIRDLKFENKSLAKLMFSPDQENHPSKAPVKYGELIVLG